MGVDDATADTAAETAAARARELVKRAVDELAAASARTEVLAAFVPERRVLGLPRAARMTPTGRVWRLGVLLLDDDGHVHATGLVARAERAARRSVTANSVAEQRAYRAAAVKGGIPAGETVNFDTTPIELTAAGLRAGDGPVLLRGGEVLVRWSPAQPDAVTPLGAYLADRVDLLVHRPEGA